MSRVQEIESRIRVIDTEIRRLEMDLQTADHGAFGQKRIQCESEIRRLRKEKRWLKDESRILQGKDPLQNEGPKSQGKGYRFDPVAMLQQMADAKDRVNPDQPNRYREALQCESASTGT